jgi:hypothetical protein
MHTCTLDIPLLPPTACAAQIIPSFAYTCSFPSSQMGTAATVMGINNGHTSRMCTEPGPAHNPNATRTNMMNKLPAGLHKTILPLDSNHTPHVQLAATSTPPQLHQCYGADDASRASPPNALHGAAIWTYPSSCHSACISCTRTSGEHNDGALLRIIPSASSLLTIRGKQ